MKLVLIGNSHLIYFWEAIKSQEILKNFDICFACTNFLSSGLEKNSTSYLKQFSYKETVEYGGKIFPKPAKFNNFSIDHNETPLVVLVGMGLDGEATYGNFGGFNNCQLPLVSSPEIVQDTYENESICYSESYIKLYYDQYYEGKSDLLLDIKNKFKSNFLGWITSPYLSSDSANYCYGDKAINSGLFLWHQICQKNSFRKVFLEKKIMDNVIDLNCHHSNDEPFMRSEYQISHNNNHAKFEYYNPFIPKFLEICQRHSKSVLG